MKNLLNFKASVFVWIAILLVTIVGSVSAQKIAIIDAGSSGSRLWVYEVNPQKATITEIYKKSGGPALSTISVDKNSIEGFISSMINEANGGIEVAANEKIPLYVLATAGMRMVPKKAESIYKIMNSMEESHKIFNDKFKLDIAMTISGRYEGFYAWLAANAKAKKLTVIEMENKENRKLAIKEGQETVGILEIGGASMQISYLAKDDCVVDTVYREGLGRIYSKSYLHYGADQIFDRLGTQLTTSCLAPSLDGIDKLHNDSMLFIGLSKPINALFDSIQVTTQHPAYKFKIKSYIDKKHKERQYDCHGNYHPATNAVYIDWVVNQFGLGDKLHKSDKNSDWTEGAALDIIINGKQPEAFNNN